MKKLLCFLCAVLAALSIFSFAACGGNEAGSNGNNMEENNGNSEEGSGDNKIKPPNYQPSLFKNIYRLGDKRYSFANLTVDAVLPDLYYSERRLKQIGSGQRREEITTLHYVVLECTVEEDFYGRIESGTTVYLPFTIAYVNLVYLYDYEGEFGDFEAGKDKDKVPDETHEKIYYNESDVREFFCEGQRFIAFFKEESAPVIRTSPTDHSGAFWRVTCEFFLGNNDLIPINGGKVDFSGLTEFLAAYGRSLDYKKRSDDYTDYIDNGMTLEKVCKNLRAFAAGQK